MRTITASELSTGDIGKHFESQTYRSNNKTAKPKIRGLVYNGDFNNMVRTDMWEWELEYFYAHKNGNIKVNNAFHLRPDTILRELQ